MDFKDKIIIVTGGAGGIGRAIASKFASLGAKIVLVDINKEHLDQAAKEIASQHNTEVRPALCDITREANVKAAIDDAMEHFGRIDVVVNNAGMMTFKLIEDLTIEDWQKVFNVDLFGAFFFTKHAFKNMKPGSSIVNISSIHAVETEPMVAPYAAAKAALVSFTRSAALEAKPKGIRVNAILPGAIDTPMLW
ncbi:MAG: SDR family oxidoreductase, partial [Proteobacteria bacterium]